jgi:16S rRNA (adenine1518-N6/adenine1519-N6)-dimethyltransferase
MNPDSPADIRALLEERGLALKKRWGQNFLVNRGARQRLIEILGPRSHETVWEIGPGLGSMTEMLTRASARVIAFELDRGLCRYLEDTLRGVTAFTLVPGDFLDTWKSIMEEQGAPDSSASLMIADIIESGVRPTRMVFTVQRELADRMASPPGRKSYSSFSVLCQTCFNVTGRGDLQPGSFYPVPDVVSSIVEMTPAPGAPEGEVLKVFSGLARVFFSSRRKTIRNNVKDGAVLGALAEEGIDLGLRAEQIAPEVFVRLARRLTGSSSP